MAKRFHIIGCRPMFSVVERTGRYDFDEPIGHTANRRHAVILQDELNRRWGDGDMSVTCDSRLKRQWNKENRLEKT